MQQRSHQAIAQFLQSQSKAVVKHAVAKPLIIKQFQAGNFHQAVFNIVKRSLSCKGAVVRLSEASTSATTSTSFK